MSLPLSGPENWLPLVALLWVASGGVLIFSTLKYFASRAVDRMQRDATAVQPPARGFAVPPRVFERDDLRDAASSEPVPLGDIMDIDAAPTTARGGDRESDAGKANEPAAAIDAAPGAPSLDHAATTVHDAVRARIARDRTSARGLSELIRALYLDQSTFTFHTIAGLEEEDSALALALIDAWLREPLAVDAWKAIYDTVRDDAAPSLP